SAGLDGNERLAVFTGLCRSSARSGTLVQLVAGTDIHGTTSTNAVCRNGCSVRIYDLALISRTGAADGRETGNFRREPEVFCDKRIELGIVPRGIRISSSAFDLQLDISMHLKDVGPRRTR